MSDVDLALFGLRSFRPGQREVIGKLLAGVSCLAIFPTGGGKSLCYQLAAVKMEGVSVVVSPLLALIREQTERMQALGLAAARLDSTQDEGEQGAVMARLAEGEVKMIFVSPERFESRSLQAVLRSVKLGLLAVDEAHCVSEWGHQFRPDYMRFAARVGRLKFAARLALTGTATDKVQRAICRKFRIRLQDRVVLSGQREELELRLKYCRTAERERELLAGLADARWRPAIVYARRQATVEGLAAMLVKAGLKARAYHAGMTGEARALVQGEFAADEIEVVVATIAFGMGVDKQNLRQVIHYDLPSSPEAYVQEAGRAGRDRRAARSLVLISDVDWLSLWNRLQVEVVTENDLTGLLARLRPGAAGGQWFSPYDASTELDLRADFIRVSLAWLELERGLRLRGNGYKRVEVRALRDKLVGYKGRRGTLLREFIELGKIDDLPRWCEQGGVELEWVLELLRDAEKAGDVSLRMLHGVVRIEAGGKDFAEVEVRFRRWVAGLALEAEEKIQGLRKLFVGGTCLNQVLAGYFGGREMEECGRCEVCLSGWEMELVEMLGKGLTADDVLLIRRAAERHRLLSRPRVLTKFLLGFHSPLVSRFRLWRFEEFGALAGADFTELKTQCDLVTRGC